MGKKLSPFVSPTARKPSEPEMQTLKVSDFRVRRDVLAEVDFAELELRMLAHYGPERLQQMQEQLHKGLEAKHTAYFLRTMYGPEAPYRK